MRLRSIILLSFFLLPWVGAWCQQATTSPAQRSGPWKISGRVVDAVSEDPISRATVFVEFTPGKALQTVVTGADGRFLFENLATARYVLRAQHSGYISEMFEDHHRYSAGVTVAQGISPPDLVFRLHREASISGKITDEHNEPVSRAYVYLIETGVFNGRSYSIRRDNKMSDEEGNYHFSHLPSGKYFLTVDAAPWYAQRRSYLHNDDKPIGSLVVAKGDPRVNPPDLDVVYPFTFYPGVTSIAAASAIELSPGGAFTANIQLHAVPSLYAQVPLPNVDFQQTYIDVL